MVAADSGGLPGEGVSVQHTKFAPCEPDDALPIQTAQMTGYQLAYGANLGGDLVIRWQLHGSRSVGFVAARCTQQISGKASQEARKRQFLDHAPRCAQASGDDTEHVLGGPRLTLADALDNLCADEQQT